MAFSSNQAGRARAIVLITVIACLAVVVGVLVLGPGASGVSAGDDAAASGSASAQGASDGAASPDASASDGDTMETIDAQYGTAAQALREQYDADPSNPSALLNLANGYFDWGVAVRSHATTDEDAERARELLGDAIGYYDTYLADNPDAKSVTVDRAICVFYTGDTAGAIAALEQLTQQDAGFAPAWANLGMFYEAAGRTDDARQAYETAIEAAGDGDAYNVKSYAQERLDALQ